ncbi:hypothetical protein BaRGS_00024241 [Batillaria attramentaria]|uniref:Uncharacterized protein n=1 Tax=Batillaria attramentaria TaxID=370345 RepID=A0ABD0KBM1_9CAEN
MDVTRKGSGPAESGSEAGSLSVLHHASGHAHTLQSQPLRHVALHARQIQAKSKTMRRKFREGSQHDTTPLQQFIQTVHSPSDVNEKRSLVATVRDWRRLSP